MLQLSIAFDFSADWRVKFFWPTSKSKVSFGLRRRRSEKIIIEFNSRLQWGMENLDFFSHLALTSQFSEHKIII